MSGFPNIKGTEAHPQHRASREAMRTTQQHDRDQMQRIYGVPEAEFYDDAGDFDGPPVIGVLLAVAAILLAGFALGWWIGHMDARSAWDFIAPTAAQARDIGAANIIERY